jgi:hypothetical protein
MLIGLHPADFTAFMGEKMVNERNRAHAKDGG